MTVETSCTCSAGPNEPTSEERIPDLESMVSGDAYFVGISTQDFFLFFFGQFFRCHVSLSSDSIILVNEIVLSVPVAYGNSVISILHCVRITSTVLLKYQGSFYIARRMITGRWCNPTMRMLLVKVKKGFRREITIGTFNLAGGICRLSLQLHIRLTTAVCCTRRSVIGQWVRLRLAPCRL